MGFVTKSKGRPKAGRIEVKDLRPGTYRDSTGDVCLVFQEFGSPDLFFLWLVIDGEGQDIEEACPLRYLEHVGDGTYEEVTVELEVL